MRRVGTGLGALAVLLAAVVGVPLALMALGQGPPSGLPTWGAVAQGLSRSVSDNALVRVAAWGCWLVWALFVVAVVIEVTGLVAAWCRRLPATSVRRRIAIPGLQGWARTLVLSAVLLLPQRALVAASAMPRSSGFGPTVTRIASPWEPARPAPEPSGSSVVIAPAPPVEPPPITPAVGRSGAHTYVVRRYDSLWSIAEHHLGSGTRWREIRDAEGGPLGADAAPVGLIHPGQVLLLPTGAARPAPPVGSATADRPAPALAASALLAAPPPPPSVGAPSPTADGERLQPPPAALPRTTVPDTTSPPPTMIEVATAHSRVGGLSTVALGELGLAGAAVLTTVEVLRRRQARHRPTGRRIRLPKPATARAELALRRAQTPDRVALVERAAASLVTALGHHGEPPPDILGLLVDDESVEILLGRPAPPPPPWIAHAEGFRWRVDPGDLSDDRPSVSAPLPALVSLGRVASGTADALINLEAAGVVTITGDPTRAAGALHAVATHLVGAPWARATDLILVAFPVGLIPSRADAAMDHVRTVATLGDVARELHMTAQVMSATARDNDCPDAFTGRVRGLAGDGWPPTVVLCARPLNTDDVNLLSAVTQPGCGVVAVTVNTDLATGWAIDVDAQPCPVSPLRLAVEPTVLDDATMTAISELIGVAQDTAGAALDDPPYDRVEISVDRPTPVPPPPSANGAQASNGFGPAHRTLPHALARLNEPVDDPTLAPVGASSDEDPAILVRVLGSVEVEGAAEFKRPKSRELVVYLAMHPNGVGESELDEALWGSAGARVVVSSTRDSTVSVARSALGGAARLLPAQGQGREKRYRLGPEVQSDWSRFCTLHRLGRQQRSTAALHQALELVRGRPFEAVISGRTYGWIHTEGHGRHIEAEVADAADLAAGLSLAAGDPIAARWAARRGLVAEPYTERLWVRLMEAADMLGESQEIERIMDEMDVVLELEGDFSSLHPNTLASYDRLSRRHRFPSDR